MAVHGEQLVWQAPHVHQVKAGPTRYGGKKGVSLQERENGTGSCEGEEREPSVVELGPGTSRIWDTNCKLPILLETREVACY